MTARARSLARSSRFLAVALRACDREIRRALPRVLRAADEEAVHDLRVGIRRMRVLLKLARPIYGRFHADAVRATYTVVHRSTGELRDAEVLDQTLAALGLDHPDFLEWVARRRRHEAALRRRVVLGLRQGDLDRAHAMLAALLLLPVRPERDWPLAKLARRSLGDSRVRVDRLSSVRTDDVTGLHALRIAYKGLRYAAEILGPRGAPELVVFAEPAAKFQKRLGELHDLDVALDVVRRVRSLPLPVKEKATFALAQLRARAVERYLAEPPLPSPSAAGTNPTAA